MLNILWMIIFIIILFIIILLYIGVGVSLKYNKTGSKLTGCFKLLILRKIKVYTIEFPSSDEEEEEDEETEDSKIDYKKIFELIKPCIRDFKEFSNSFLRAIRIERLDNHLIFGLDSFADTGKYIGIIWGVFAVVNTSHKNARLTAEPSFNGFVFESQGEGIIEVNILKLIIPALRLISKKEIRELIKGAINEQRNKGTD